MKRPRAAGLGAVVGVILFFVGARSAGADVAPPEGSSAAVRETAQAQARIEKLVDSESLKVRGTILGVAYSPAAEDNGYLVRIDACDKKAELGKVIMLVQGDAGRTPGQPWPADGKEATIYRVGTSPYEKSPSHFVVVPLYVPDRQAAIVWAFSQ